MDTPDHHRESHILTVEECREHERLIQELKRELQRLETVLEAHKQWCRDNP